MKATRMFTNPQVRLNNFDLKSSDIGTKRFFVCSQPKCDRMFDKRETLHFHMKTCHKNSTAQEIKREFKVPITQDAYTCEDERLAQVTLTNNDLKTEPTLNF